MKCPKCQEKMSTVNNADGTLAGWCHHYSLELLMGSKGMNLCTHTVKNVGREREGELDDSDSKQRRER